MATSHDLKGLIRFLNREEWRACFETVFDEHFAPVLKTADLAFEDLAEMFGDEMGNNLWGCAFEDFLTRNFDIAGHNIVDEYLRRRSWRESALSKAYMKGLRNAVMSLYEVSNIVPGKSLLARDLIRGGEPIFVSEESATGSLVQWDRVAVRIVPVMGKNIFSGGLLLFTPQATETLFDGLRKVFGKKHAKKLPVIEDRELRVAAPMFTLSWLFATLEQVSNLPEMQNSDGDELVFHEIRFPLAEGATQQDIALRLKAAPGMAQENVTFWNWLEETPGDKQNPRPEASRAFEATMESGACVLGNVVLEGRSLTLSVNSAQRAEQGTALIRDALGDLVDAPSTTTHTVEEMMAEPSARSDRDADSSIDPELATQIIHQQLDRHYREILDQPVGMLGDKTPRQNVKTPSGRQKVAEWLKYLENQSMSRHDPFDPMATYDFGWLWRELGVLDLRR